jgi:hypothetical protein
MAPKGDEILLHTAAAQTIHNALIDAGVDLERARSNSSVYYPDLVPQVSRVATQPEVIDAARSIQGERVDPCDVLAIILSITFVTASSASIL